MSWVAPRPVLRALKPRPRFCRIRLPRLRARLCQIPQVRPRVTLAAKLTRLRPLTRVMSREVGLLMLILLTTVLDGVAASTRAIQARPVEIPAPEREPGQLLPTTRPQRLPRPLLRPRVA